MTEHNDLQHKLVNDVYAELGTISKHSQDVIDYLMRHGWIRTPAEAEAAARGEVPGRSITESELIAAVDETNHEDMNEYQKARALLVHLGHTIPDPEPTSLPSEPGAVVKMRKHHQWVRALTGAWISTDGSVLGQEDAQLIADKYGFEVIRDGVKAPGGDEPEDERDRAWWIENANVDAEDCEACGVEQDLCPVHHGIALGVEFVTKKIAALGDDPELFNSIPNPPGATDDH